MLKIMVGSNTTAEKSILKKGKIESANGISTNNQTQMTNKKAQLSFLNICGCSPLINFLKLDILSTTLRGVQEDDTWSKTQPRCWSRPCISSSS